MLSDTSRVAEQHVLQLCLLRCESTRARIRLNMSGDAREVAEPRAGTASGTRARISRDPGAEALDTLAPALGRQLHEAPAARAHGTC